MKRLLLATALLSWATNCLAETKQALTLHMGSSADIVYLLDTEPLITFESQSMVIAAGGDSSSIPMQDVKSWELGWIEYASLCPEMSSDNIVIQVHGNTVNVNNPTQSPIAILNISGTMVATDSQQHASFDLPKGLYIISIGNNSYKISIR